jgi:hypothetical protein
MASPAHVRRGASQIQILVTSDSLKRSPIGTCPICKSQGSRVERKMNSALKVHYCPNCHHRTAEHGQGSQNLKDYHLQYEQNKFVESLRQTRIRQANLIYDVLHQLRGEVNCVVDVGSGRGWLLETFKEKGVAKLAGMENSKVGLATLAALKIPGIETDASLRFAPEGVPFAPRVICFLDVLEHFSGSVQAVLEPFMQNFHDSIEFIVIKVPASDGLLYRIANGLAGLGWYRPLAQLYQVGTFPPHYHYFSSQSLDKLASMNPEIATHIIGDQDFESDSFRHRFWSAPKVVREICRVIGGGLYYAVRLFKLYDSRILFLDLRPTRGSRSEDRLKRNSRNV